MRKLLQTIIIMAAVIAPPALTSAQTPAKTPAAQPSVAQSGASQNGFVFPPPSGSLDGTVPGGTRGIPPERVTTISGTQARAPVTGALPRSVVKPVANTTGTTHSDQ